MTISSHAPGAGGGPAAARRIALAAAVGFVAVGILAAFVDLPLSRAVVNPDSGWATFLADYGEVPGYLLAIASVALVIHVRLFARGASEPDARDSAGAAERPSRPDAAGASPENERGRAGAAAAVRVVAGVLWTAILAFLLVYGVARTAEFVVGDVEVWALLVMGVAGGAVVVALWGLVSREARERLGEPARATTWLAVISPIVIVQLFKALWGRVRFRHLADDFSDFTAWFAPQGVTGNESFPSGHAAMGWMLLPIAFWVAWRLASSGGARAAVWTVTVAFGVAVAASRVVVGAHYLSDVAFSTALAWALTPWLVLASARASAGAGEGAAQPRGSGVDPGPNPSIRPS